jgi:DNA-directed RNA polymerase sigma subunit (sigma70/sigma32)
LTTEQETELFRQLDGKADWDDERENIARHLIENRLRLVTAVAEKSSTSGRLSIRECVGQGNAGLMHAVRSDAINPRGDFAALAAECIENAIIAAGKGQAQSLRLRSGHVTGNGEVGISR